MDFILIIGGLFIVLIGIVCTHVADEDWQCYLGGFFIVFGLICAASGAHMGISYVETSKKYDEKAIFYKVEYNGKPIVIINPEIKEGTLSNKEITIKPENGYLKIDRSEAIDLIK